MEHARESSVVPPINGLQLISVTNYRESLGTLSSYYYFYYDNLSATNYDNLNRFLTVLAIIVAVVCSGLFLFHVVTILFARFYFYYSSKPVYPTEDVTGSAATTTKSAGNAIFPDLKSVPGVSIIKPLTGADVHVLVNLTSFFHLDYPTYELLFCVEDPDDIVCNVVSSLMEKYPNIDAKLLIGAEICGVNPKINNMNKAYQISKYDLILISDVGIYMYPDTLSNMVSTMFLNDSVGLVHQVPFLLPYTFANKLITLFTPEYRKIFSTSEEEADSSKDQCVANTKVSFGSMIQLIYFGCWHAKMYLSAAILGINCTTGMSCLMRKAILDKVDGIKAFGKYLAEDFFLSKHFYDENWQVKISNQPAWQNSAYPTVSSFHERMTRWYQLRIAMVPLASLSEPMSQCLPNGIIHALSYAYLFPQYIDPVVFFFFHVLTWFILDFILLHQMQPPESPTGITKPQFFTSWLFQECTGLFIHFRAIFSRYVKWRGKFYRIHWGGVAEQIFDKANNKKPLSKPFQVKTKTATETDQPSVKLNSDALVENGTL